MNNVPTDPPTLTATLIFPLGLDRNDLTIADEKYGVVASQSRRPDSPGVGNWDARAGSAPLHPHKPMAT